MSTAERIKTRTLIRVGIICLIYPLVLFAAILIKVYKYFFAETKPKSVTDEIAVVTGAAHGLGRAISIELAQNGCHIVAVDINLEGAQETARLIEEKYNVKAKAYKVDVSNYEQVVQLNENVTADLGAATILVNNAGVLKFTDMLDPAAHEIQRMINVNFTAHFWTNKVFLPKMKQLQKGHIVAIASVAGLFPLVHNSTYSSTKYAVRALMMCLRLELKTDKNHNIKTTTVFPAFLETNDEVTDLVQQQRFDKIYPLITGEEAAQRIVHGLLRNELEITLPQFITILYRFFEILPATAKDFFMTMSMGGISERYIKLLKSKS